LGQFSINFLIERVPSNHHGILVFWDFGRIMAIKPIEHRDSKLGSIGFFNINIKFLIERVPSCSIFEFWDFGRIGSRPQAQMTTSPKLKMILTLRPLKRAIICPILIVGTIYLICSRKVRVLVKARFPDSQATDPKSQTALLTTADEQTYV
jgi:hypothetical protein